MHAVARRLLAIALTVGIVGLLVVAEAERYRASATAIGVVLAEAEEGGLRVELVDPGSPAALAGLREGDRLLEVGGRALSDLASYDAVAVEFDRGWPYEVLVERSEGKLRVEIRPGIAHPDLTSVLNAVACLAFLALALLALRHGSGDLRGLLLAAYSSSIALELAMPEALAGYPGYVHWAYPALYLMIGLQIGMELHLVSSIPEPRLPHRRWALTGFYGAGGGLGVFYAASQIAFDRGVELPWSQALADLVFWDVGMTLWAIAVVALLAGPALRWPRPVGRQQAALVLLGVLPWSALVLVRVVVESGLGRSAPWIDHLDPFALLVYLSTIFVAIFRYHLFDLEIVVKRSMVYGFLAVALLAVFYGLLVVFGLAVSLWLSPSQGSMLGVALGGLALGLLFNPLRGGIQRAVERRFFPERRALRARLIELASELPALGNLGSMGRELVGRLSEIFELRWASVLLSQEGSGLLSALESRGVDPELVESLVLSREDPAIERLRTAHRSMEIDKLEERSETLGRRLRLLEADLLVPLLRRKELVGVLVLGRKESGDPFRSEEKELLSLFSHHVASVFENARLFQSATRDSLTGLLRREAILEALERELRRAVRFGRPLTVGMADLDHFKAVNDRFGHLVGDLMLKGVAQAIRGGLRATDLVGRYGGEEFLLVLTETELQGAMTVAEKIRSRVEQVEAASAGATARVTLSIGLAEVDERRARDLTAKDLVELADRALYAAKSAGRNRVDSFGVHEA